MLEERRLDVLRAIVTDFVATEEPVGSKALAERHALGVSPATVRNDMAALEDEGYITQPHTSAGRIPTDKGYRLFVDRLSGVKPLSVAERKAITLFLDGTLQLDDVVRRSVRLLAQLTRQVAVVQYPSLSRSSVRHVEVVALAPARLLLILIVDTGRVEQRTVELPAGLGEDEVGELRALLNARLAGRRLADANAVLTELPTGVRASLQGGVWAVVAGLRDALVERPEERVAVAGAANLTRHPGELASSLRPVLEAIEEQVVLLRLVDCATTGSETSGMVTVRIGGENVIEEFRRSSVVSVGYGAAGVAPLAGMGVLGPTRMDYPATMAAVRAVARYVGEIVAGSRTEAAGVGGSGGSPRHEHASQDG